MISEQFKYILDNYNNERLTDYKISQFSVRFRDKLPKILSEFISNDNFNVKAVCGFINWVDYPWISIKDQKFESEQESLLIYYKFNPDNSTTTLSIAPKLEECKYYGDVKKISSDYLHESNTNDFQISEENEFTLLSKTYEYDDLIDSQLKKDLNFIISIYNDLSDFLLDIIYENEELEKKQIFDEYLFSEKLIVKEEFPFKKMRVAYGKITPKIKVKNIETSYLKNDCYSNNLNSIEEFFTDKNIERIIECDVSYDDYLQILTDIKLNSSETFNNLINLYNLDFNELSIRDKVLLFSKSWVNTQFKSVGKLLGSYSFNTIKIDDRLSNSLIITSIIHELTHFLLEKILKEILMRILNTNDTPLISSYIKILLEDNDLNYLLDEFCAHTVEGRFALYGFQDYSSFNYKLNEISHLYSKEDIDYALVIANTFAYDIKDIIEEFIDDDLREDIKDEFLKLNSQPNYEPLKLEIESKLENNDFIESIAIILTSGIGEALNSGEKLERYMKKYEHFFIYK